MSEVATQNITVDDTDPSVTYTGSGWESGPGCTGCNTLPIDLRSVKDGTWHQAQQLSSTSNSLTAQFTFKGKLSDELNALNIYLFFFYQALLFTSLVS